MLSLSPLFFSFLLFPNRMKNILQPVCHPIEHFGLFIGNNIRIVSVSILSMYECFLLIFIVIVQRFLIPCFIFPYLPSSILFLPPSLLTYIDTCLPISLIRISLTDISLSISFLHLSHALSLSLSLSLCLSVSFTSLTLCLSLSVSICFLHLSHALSLSLSISFFHLSHALSLSLYDYLSPSPLSRFVSLSLCLSLSLFHNL